MSPGTASTERQGRQLVQQQSGNHPVRGPRSRSSVGEPPESRGLRHAPCPRRSRGGTRGISTSVSPSLATTQGNDLGAQPGQRQAPWRSEPTHAGCRGRAVGL